MPEYLFPRWRQVVFVAVLIVILVVTLAPPVSQGKVSIRVVGIIPSGVVSHVYVKFASAQLHTAGFPDGSGIVTIGQLLPRIDLVQNPSQVPPDALISASISSGRYDMITLQAANGTIILQNGQQIPVSIGSSIQATVTIPVPPNRFGDVLFILNADYLRLIASSPAIALTLVQAVGA